MKESIRGLVAGGIAGTLTVMLMVRGVRFLTAGLPIVAQALWERSSRLIPLPVFSFFIVRFKFAAKPLAFWGMIGSLVVGAAVAGGVLGRWQWVRGHRWRTALIPFALIFVPVVLLSWGPATDLLVARYEADGVPVSPPTISWQVIAAVAAYAAVFAVLYTVLSRSRHSRVAPPSTIPTDRDGLTRREVIHRVVVVVGGTVGGVGLLRWLSATGQTAVAFAQSLFDRVKGLPAEITPTPDFYVVSKNPPGFDPVVDAGRWHLELGGLVNKPATLTLEAVRALQSVQRPHTLECISNDVGGDLISNAHWRGARLKDVLDQAGGVGAKAIQVAFHCADGYTESLPVAEALHPDTLLAYEMNGAPLTAKHGFPLRLLVPGHFGMKNPKWITKIEPVDHNILGYWERSGWSQQAVVKTMSKFTAPSSSHMMYKVGEEIALGGVAYAGDRGIKAVDVSVDDGKTWQPAQLKPPQGPYTWVLWAAVWTPSSPGDYGLRVRATDGAGNLQVKEEVTTLPDGASGYHWIRLRVTK
jgi:DMSO/TMAO reductase YedYZ molybdopterin-dependent catalytic subunit